MKKYLWSLILSILAGVIVVSMSYDSETFGFGLMIIYYLVIPFAIFPSLLLKLESRKSFKGTKFWDILIWPVWFIVIVVYSQIAYSNFYKGDSTLYSNMLNFNHSVTWILLIVPIVQFIYLLITNIGSLGKDIN